MAINQKSIAAGVLAVFLLALSVRVGWVVVRYAGQERWSQVAYPDEEAYLLAADSLAEGRGLIDEFGYRATYMPLYPGFLALFVNLPGSLFWARLIQAGIGAVAAPAAYLLAWQWIRLAADEWQRQQGNKYINIIPLLAGGAVALDPFLVFFSGLLLTETLFTTFLLIAWVFVLPMCKLTVRLNGRQVFVAGLFLLVAVYLRPSAIILALLVPAAVVICRRMSRDGVYAGAAIGLMIGCGLLPWAARNRMVTGHWVWLTTRGGISLYDGMRAGTDGGSDLAATKTMPAVAEMDEIEWNRYFKQRAWTLMREDPGRVAELAWLKFKRTWSLSPNVAQYSSGPIAALAGLWSGAILFTAVIGLWRYRRAVSCWFMLLLPVAVFTLLHMLFVGSVRYRVPVMPMVMVLAAAGVGVLMSFLGRRQPQ